MSLKNQKAIPQIPKSRTKKISVIKESVPEKKESEVEYICEVYFTTDISKEKQLYCISLNTVRQFSNLNYEISVKTKKQKNLIDIIILGLKTKADYLNRSGSAVCEVVFENLYGKHTVKHKIHETNVVQRFQKEESVTVPEARKQSKALQIFPGTGMDRENKRNIL